MDGRMDEWMDVYCNDAVVDGLRPCLGSRHWGQLRLLYITCTMYRTRCVFRASSCWALCPAMFSAPIGALANTEYIVCNARASPTELLDFHAPFLCFEVRIVTSIDTIVYA
jgi:hypothetical protein